MKTTSADLLEFEALKRLLGRFVSSPLGRVDLAEAAPWAERVSLPQYRMTEGTLEVLEKAFV